MRYFEIINENEGPVKLYHITNKANFKLNPNYAPEDNSFSIYDRSGNKGIYLARNVETWVNGHGYVRPFVAEIYADPSALEHDKLGRWGGEIFIPADQFDKLKVNRVVPLDVIAREEYGDHGWIERSHGSEFDTGKPITRADYGTYPFRDWKYDKDTRNMSSDEIKKIKQHFKIGYKARLKESDIIAENIKVVPVLYHGTCPENADRLIANGWAPRSGSRGGNMGNPKYLYLSTGYEDAMWFSNEKGCNTVVALHNIPYDHLIVDPEDGYADTVEEELNLKGGMPGKVALTKPLSADHFKIIET